MEGTLVDIGDINRSTSDEGELAAAAAAAGDADGRSASNASKKQHHQSATAGGGRHNVAGGGDERSAAVRTTKRDRFRRHPSVDEDCSKTTSGTDINGTSECDKNGS